MSESLQANDQSRVVEVGDIVTGRYLKDFSQLFNRYISGSKEITCIDTFMVVDPDNVDDNNEIDPPVRHEQSDSILGKLVLGQTIFTTREFSRSDGDTEDWEIFQIDSISN